LCLSDSEWGVAQFENKQEEIKIRGGIHENFLRKTYEPNWDRGALTLYGSLELFKPVSR